MQKEWLEEIHGAVNNLPARGRTWVIIRFGFEDDEPRTLTDMTLMFHLSENRARKTEEEALNGVRKEYKACKNLSSSLPQKKKQHISD